MDYSSIRELLFHIPDHPFRDSGIFLLHIGSPSIKRHLET
jgi:hypothetical protein